MRTFTRLGIVLTLMLLPFAVVAQDGPSPEPGQPTELPDLPAPPYVKEDIEALQAHLNAIQARIEQQNTKLVEQKQAAIEPGISDEERAAREQAVAETEDAVKALDGQLKGLQDALAAAMEGPTRAQLAARVRYDAAVAQAEQVLLDLTLGIERHEDSEIPSTPDGGFAKAVRDAEGEQKRIAKLAANAEVFEFANSRVFDKLSDIEKLEYELRWAGERLQLSIDCYDHLKDTVFGAYKDYGSHAMSGLDAVAKAREEWQLFEVSPARGLELPNAAVPVNSLDAVSRKIDDLYRGRSGQLNSIVDELVVTNWRGSLQAIQLEIDTREDYRERLEADSERLKNVLAETGSGPAAKPEEAGAKPDSELEDYQKLSRQIDNYKQALIDNRAEIERLQGERVALEKTLADKVATEAVVEEEIKGTEATIEAIELQFAKPGAAGTAPKAPSVEVPTYTRRPAIVLFGLRERLKAERERLSSAKRDTRQAQTQLDILDRRIVRLNERSTEIQSELLPGTRSHYYEEVGKTTGIRAAKVVAVLLVAWLLLFLIRKIGQPLIDRVVRRADKKVAFSADEQQRARTLMTVFMTTARVVVYITAILFAVAQFDVDYGPLLVAAGGLSLAVGFGAQTLVKDFFAGFFILLEGQFSIGDVIEINGKTGTVENLNLRTTVIRALNGDVHTIPNGEISVTTNMTKLWSRAIVDIGVAYEENVDHVGQVIEGVAKEMRETDPWDKKLLDAIYMGVLSLGDSAVVLRMLLKTRAGEQWGAAREFNRRCKLKFDELGIEIPWPQQVHSMKWYDGKDDEVIEQATRKKRANLLRYVRKMRGEVTEEEAELAKLSVEERDRAETLANREAELAKEESEPVPEPAKEVVKDAAQEAAAEAEMPDAEKLARKLATQKIAKDEAEKRQAEAAADNEPEAPPEEPKKD